MEVVLKVIIFGLGLFGAVLFGVVDFGPTSAIDQNVVVPMTTSSGEFIIVGHGGGLGPCGGKVSAKKSWFDFGDDC